jgi:predicted ATPase/DNA-binding CsgD family transcriptional regulator
MRCRQLLEAASAAHGALQRPRWDASGAFDIAFAAASDALGAALEVRRALSAERWSDGAEPRVRIAVHCVETPSRGERPNAVPMIVRGQRLRALAHAGQVLVGEAAASLAIEHLPDGAWLTDLGEHRLPGLERPERIFELRHAAIRGGFVPPSVGRLDPVHTLSEFVGREEELGEVVRLLSRTRMLTLTGPGGAGKTRLAQQAASLSLAPDGVFLVELGRVEDPAVLPGAVLAGLGVSEEPEQPPLQTAARQLRGRRALVVLDNCEHMVDASAEVARELLIRCPALRLLATSRESPLGVAGEMVWSVPGMCLPIADVEEDLERSDAVQLFVRRARQLLPDFALDDDTGPIVARICRSLDGMPLAIELAAARLRTLSVSEIADGLGDRLRLLSGGWRVALPRHRTLRGSIEWSHDLLGGPEQTLLRRLSVFAGGFTLSAAEAVGADTPAEGEAMHELVEALVDKSLIATERRGDAVRLGLLESIRQYAAERLDEAGERAAVERRHALHFRALAADADQLRLRADGRERLTIEGPNLRAALEWGLAADPETALSIAAGLGRWWVERDQYREGSAGCARALAAGDPAAWPTLRALVNWGAGQLALYQSEFALAAQAVAAALAYGEAADDTLALGRAHALAAAAFACLAPVEGVRHGSRAVELMRSHGDPVELAWALAPLATAYASIDDYPATRAAGEECAAIARAAGDDTIGAWAEWVVGVVLSFEGRLDASRERLQRSIDLVGTSTPVLWGLALGCRLGVDATLGNAAELRQEAVEALERASAVASLAEAAVRPGLCLMEAALGRLQPATVAGEPAGRSGILYFEGNAHDALAKVALARGDVAAAVLHADELGRLAQATSNRRFRAQSAYIHGRAALIGGDLSTARDRLHSALSEQLSLGARLHAIDTLEALGALSGADGNWGVAARLLAAAGGERERLGAVRLPDEGGWRQGLVAAGRSVLGDESFAACWQQGLLLTFDEAVPYARRSRGARGRGGSSGWDALTDMEAKVARLAADGLNNREIGERLFISRGTVKVHLSRAFHKLGVANRVELARALPPKEVWPGG